MALASLAVGRPFAQAYVPGGPHLLSRLTEKIGKVDGLEVKQKLTLFDREKRIATASLAETLHYAFPRTFRSDITADNVRRIYLDDGYRSLTVVDDRISSADKESLQLESYKDLLLYRTRLGLHKRLARRGVDVAITSLGRFQDKIVYVIGAHFPDTKVSQVWIDKENALPFCWLQADPQGTVLEIYYTGWRRFGETWYPMRISFFQDDLLIREIRVSTVRLNPPYGEDEMSVEHLKAVSLPALEEEAADPELDDPHELWDVQKTIENFKKIYE